MKEVNGVNGVNYKFKSFPVKNGTVLKTQIQCPDCKKMRWILKREFKRQSWSGYCRVCSSKRNGNRSLFKNPKTNPNYHGGITYRNGGYRAKRITKNHIFYIMTDKNGYVLEHRLVMAQYLKRPLEIYEIVHHKNGIKNDNRLENLELVSGLQNTAYSLYDRYIQEASL